MPFPEKLSMYAGVSIYFGYVFPHIYPAELSPQPNISKPPLHTFVPGQPGFGLNGFEQKQLSTNANIWLLPQAILLTIRPLS